jgi:radical SAM superfamily enzyme YgiQ (UPF0313 family)
MDKPIVHFILPRDECFTTQPAYFGKAIYSPVAGPLALAAITPADEWDMFLTDENIEPIDYEKKCDVAAISIMTVYANRGYQIADEFRKRGVQVVMGGSHATYLPYEVLQHADAVVVGEAELIWNKVLSDAREGRMKGIYKADRYCDMLDMKRPRWDLLKRDKYMVANFVQTARGCPHECTFCCEKGINGNRYRFRPIEDVIYEIKSLPDRDIGIYDVDVFSQPDRAYKMLEAMIPLGKRWQSAVSSRLAENDRLLEVAKKSGCYMLCIGFESLSSQNLNDLNKGFNQPDRYKALIKKVQSHGMMVLALTMFGFDSDDESVFEKTTKFWKEAGADGAAFSILTPYPGTKIFHQLHSEGRITSYDWSHYDQSDVVYEPKQMSQETLRAGFGYAWETFYSWSSVMGRFPLLGKQDKLYWAMTNALMHKFDSQGSKNNKIVRDDTLPPDELLAEHIRPEAAGMLHEPVK